MKTDIDSINERDEVSRITTGENKPITKQKINKQ